MIRYLAPLALGAVLAAPALAQEPGWDTDRDDRLDVSELDEGLRDAGLFDRWDADGDAALTRTEVANGVFDLWDVDGDGALSIDEWDTAVDLWFGEAAVDLSVAAWDPDGDGTITPDEFRSGLAETPLFARFAGSPDPALALREDGFIGALFDAADPDGDGFVDTGIFAALDDDPDWTEAADLDPFEGEPPLIERGEAFVQLPIPCRSGSGDRSGCSGLAERFCEALGYGPPIDFIAADDSLHVVRCQDEI